MAVFSKFFGNAVSEGAAFAAGLAIGPTLMPLLRALESATWEQYPDKPPEAAGMALGVATGKIAAKQGAKWAKQNGYDQDAFDALVAVAQVGPALGQAMELWRRSYITDAEFETALDRLGLADTWHSSIKKLKLDVLDPADLARAIHKSLIPDPGLLAVPQPTGAGKVKKYPVYPIDALTEALASGYDKERLGVLVGLQGNPMGAHEAAQAFFRGVLEQADYDRAIAEGNTRNEWGPPIMEQSRQIPTSVDYAENTIRGWSSKADFFAGAATHGMTQAHAEILWQNHGRPLAHNQVLIGLLRGGIYDGPTSEIDPVYLTSLRHSSIRPEYYNLAWAGRYHFPPFFQTINLLTKGLITAATATEWLTIQAYDPTAIKAVVDAASGATPKVKKFTDAQIRSAARSGAIDHAEAITRLEANGYSAADAEIILNLPTTTPAKP